MHLRAPQICWIFALLLLTSCEEDVTAIVGTDDAFTLYGVLSPQLDTQWVRVFPIENRLRPLPQEPLEAVFTATDFANGETTVWQDSVLLGADGQYTYAYYRPGPAEYGRLYRLEVTRTDGAATRADVRVPPRVELEPQEAYVEASAFVIVPVRAEHAPRLLYLELIYHVQLPSNAETRISFPADIPEEIWQQQIDGEWLVRLNLTSHRNAIEEFLKAEVAVLDMRLRALVVNEAWNPPSGVFDPEVLVHPFALSNVENGFGFVGAGYRVETTWLPPADVLEAAGFRVR